MLDQRAGHMRENGIFYCPDWCEQDPEEHMVQQHQGPWREVTAPDGSFHLRARAWLGWWRDDYPGENLIEIEVQDDGAMPCARIQVQSGWLYLLTDLVEGVELQLNGFDEVPAYDGAEDDEDGTSIWAMETAG